MRSRGVPRVDGARRDVRAVVRLMALIWKHTSGGQRYEIRSAGRSIRLYTNGVLHSQYHPDHIFGGGVWDLLGLPVLWRDTRHLSGVLLLGLGGGAVVRQLCELVDWDRFVALEQNPVHLDLARRFFGLDGVPAELVHGDAARWIDEHRGGDRFDLVIDDLFSDAHGEARRTVPFSRRWYRGLRDLLSERGTLVVNFADAREMKQSLAKIRSLRHEFSAVYKLSVPAYGNAVAVLLRDRRRPEDLSRAVHAVKPRRRRARLRYDVEEVRL